MPVFRLASASLRYSMQGKHAGVPGMLQWLPMVYAGLIVTMPSML